MVKAAREKNSLRKPYTTAARERKGRLSSSTVPPFPTNLPTAFSSATARVVHGATTDHAGYFEQADGGTIFLDEIGDMDIDIQAKILRALQEKKVRRVGEKKERSVDFRLISATHRDFSEAITGSTFRADLYYRLEEYPLFVPPFVNEAKILPYSQNIFSKSSARPMTLPSPVLMHLQ